MGVRNEVHWTCDFCGERQVVGCADPDPPRWQRWKFRGDLDDSPYAEFGIVLCHECAPIPSKSSLGAIRDLLDSWAKHRDRSPIGTTR